MRKIPELLKAKEYEETTALTSDQDQDGITRWVSVTIFVTIKVIKRAKSKTQKKIKKQHTSKTSQHAVDKMQ